MHVPPPSPWAPGESHPMSRGGTARSWGKRPATSGGRGSAHPDPSPWPGWKQASGVPEAQPSLGVGSLPVLPPPRTNRGWGSSGCSHWERREEKENVRLPVSHGFRHQHSARGPQPRPAQCPPAVMGTPSLPPPPRSRGCPRPAPNPKLPLRAPGRSPRRREKVVWQRLLWARLRVPPSSPIYF